MGFPLEPQLDSICVGGQGRPVQKIKKKRGGDSRVSSTGASVLAAPYTQRRKSRREIWNPLEQVETAQFALNPFNGCRAHKMKGRRRTAQRKMMTKTRTVVLATSASEAKSFVGLYVILTRLGYGDGGCGCCCCISAAAAAAVLLAVAIGR